MIPWQLTSHNRIEVRPAYGTIPVAPGWHIVGWEVRVWHEGPAGLGTGGCNVCKKSCQERRVSETVACKRADFSELDAHADGGYWAPYAHECSAPVPWAARSAWPSEGWQQPHHHPVSKNATIAALEPHDRRATPILYANAQLAYAAGLELLGIDVPERMHWKPEAA